MILLINGCHNYITHNYLGCNTTCPLAPLLMLPYMSEITLSALPRRFYKFPVGDRSGRVRLSRSVPDTELRLCHIKPNIYEIS